MASSANPDLVLVCDLVVEHVIDAILPTPRSYALLRFGLLCTDTRVLVLPHAAISVEWMIHASIDRATGNPFPATFCTEKVPYGGAIDPAANQNIVWYLTEVARLAISRGRLGAFSSVGLITSILRIHE